MAGGLDSAWEPEGEDDEFDIRGVVVQDRNGRQYYVEMEEPDDLSGDEDSDDDRGDEGGLEGGLELGTTSGTTCRTTSRTTSGTTYKRLKTTFDSTFQKLSGS